MRVTLGRLRDAVVGRTRSRLRPLKLRVAARLARIQRRRLGDVTFVAVTGSAAKTTTKDLLAAVLASGGSVRSSPDTENRLYSIARTILATRPSDFAAVQEIGIARVGSLERPLRLLQPRIGVVTTVGLDHFREFRTREAIAAEKGQLIEALPADGVAVLNADDALVRAMAARSRARVITYGLSSESDVRGEDVTAAWPERLALTVHSDGRAVRVRTRLCGAHWAHAVLAAIAAGRALGVDPEDAARAVAAVEPARGRMSPVALPDGVTFIRDDWKAPVESLGLVFDFLREARARRKVLVVGTLSDYGGTARTKYRRAAAAALEVADEVLFVGRWSGRALPAHAAARPAALRVFPTVRAASEYLQPRLGPGDLVLLKGSATADHLGRIALARQREVACWRTSCGRTHLCDGCRLRMVPGQGA